LIRIVHSLSFWERVRLRAYLTHRHLAGVVVLAHTMVV
jgi:hypothetical protein